MVKRSRRTRKTTPNYKEVVPDEVVEVSEEEEEDLVEDDETEEEIRAFKKPKSQLKTTTQTELKFNATKQVQPAKIINDLVPRVTSNQVEQSQSLQWIDKYAPSKSNDICINPQKLRQVRQLLYDMILNKSHKRLLVLTGPAGSSKSTTVKLLADEIIASLPDHQLDEYGLLGTSSADPHWIEYLDGNSVEGTNQSDSFEEFLTDAKYRVGSNMAVVLIEELPNVFHYETLLKFRNKIREWIYCNETLPPLVICLTDVEYTSEQGTRDYSYTIDNNLTMDTLLGKELANSAQVEHIKFNSIANRFLKKTIGQLVKSERNVFNKIPYKELTEFMDEIIKIGDIRSVIFNLEMWATNYSKEAKWYNRENQINLFHAIGKIIYSSSEFSELSSDERDYNSVEQVLANYTNNQLLNMAILENYSIYNDAHFPVECGSAIVDALSLNDLLTGEANREYAIRSTRQILQAIPASSSTRKSKVKFPRQFKMVRQYNKTYAMIRSYQRYIDHESFQNLNLLDGYYLPLIYNKRSKTRFRYNRLGGRFHEIHADESMGTNEEEEESQFYNRDQFEIDITEKIAEEERGDYSDQDELSEEISDSEIEGDQGDDDDEAGFSSDPELDVLISQGRL
ncbi:hypothetical protein PICST_28605 [Scheffersomyces stipitis CBS 6054]|uniref:Checkpoint protein RAD24-like helical bundle domain-containing protein n=1 Tax=Scheffersomyces stipitis (strain ATCC 58785 / CBS 6054 / NBRC 10063 / NRRL Y-11545) TaxID=322104 RepID=A3GGH4_PICST|nr:predicted protein [Scheffersomyces stipitis CBS 6054]EAZ63523.2 hypothetical protein PICST_28605 [Scheffersomyces stipitis CBS 6054]